MKWVKDSDETINEETEEERTQINNKNRGKDDWQGQSQGEVYLHRDTPRQ